jgi:DNA-binding XRE family transcriptional regulator
MPRKSKTVSGSALAVRIGRNKNARILLGMTQGQLAEVLDLENVKVSRIETGGNYRPSTAWTRFALKVSLTALLADTNKSNAIADLLRRDKRTCQCARRSSCMNSPRPMPRTGKRARKNRIGRDEPVSPSENNVLRFFQLRRGRADSA